MVTYIVTRCCTGNAISTHIGCVIDSRVTIFKCVRKVFFVLACVIHLQLRCKYNLYRESITVNVY